MTGDGCQVLASWSILDPKIAHSSVYCNILPLSLNNSVGFWFQNHSFMYSKYVAVGLRLPL